MQAGATLNTICLKIMIKPHYLTFIHNSTKLIISDVFQYEICIYEIGG